MKGTSNHQKCGRRRDVSQKKISGGGDSFSKAKLPSAVLSLLYPAVEVSNTRCRVCYRYWTLQIAKPIAAWSIGSCHTHQRHAMGLKRRAAQFTSHLCITDPPHPLLQGWGDVPRSYLPERL